LERRKSFFEKFFSSLGIDVLFLLQKNDEFVFQLETLRFEQHKDYLQRWFVVVDQCPEYTALQERLRGSDQTAS
jgi:guanylate kinase